MRTFPRSGLKFTCECRECSFLNRFLPVPLSRFKGLNVPGLDLSRSRFCFTSQRSWQGGSLTILL